MSPLHLVRSILWLTAAICRRLLREGMVVRSLVFPAGIIIGTLLVTLSVASLVRGNAKVALTPEIWAETALVEDIAALGLEPYESAAPRTDIEDWVAWAGSDGQTLWVSGGAPEALQLEALLRERNGASWVPEPRFSRPTGPQAAMQGRRVLQGMALLYALYGVVFGAGMVVRDRQEGTLEAEFSLPVPRWTHGAARWLAGSVGLSLFYALGLALLDALLGVPDPGALLRHGIAANAAATAIGLFAAGRAGAHTGFSGPLTSGMSAVTALVGVSVIAPAAAPYVPLASIASTGDGWAPLGVALLCAVIAVWTFARKVEA